MSRNAIGPLTRGEKVRILLTRRGMTLKELGKHTGWSAGTMSKFQNGDWLPPCWQRDEFVQCVAEALGTTVEELRDDDFYNLIRRMGEGLELIDSRLRRVERATDRIAKSTQETRRPAGADARTESELSGSSHVCRS